MYVLKSIAVIVIGLPFLMYFVVAIVGHERFWEITHGPADMGPVDFASLKKNRRPNQYLVCPSTMCRDEDRDAVSPVYNLEATQLSTVLLESLTDERDLQRVDEGTDPLKLRFVQRTAKMRYPDTIRIEILPRDETTSEIAIYSQSQVGYGDAGVNGKRVRRWLARLTDHES